MFCRHCGCLVVPYRTTCQNCHSNPLESHNYCQECGKATKEDDTICKSCQSPLQPKKVEMITSTNQPQNEVNVEPVQTPVEPKNESIRPIQPSLLLMILCALIPVIGIILCSKNKSSKIICYCTLGGIVGYILLTLSILLFL